MQLVAELEQIQQELGACDDQARRLCEGLSPEELCWRPTPKSWYVEPPPLIRLPAPKPLRPPLEESTAEAALQDFLESQELMLHQIQSANGLDLCRARVVSPIASYIRMSLLAFFKVHTGHDRRHLLQVSGLRDQLQG